MDADIEQLVCACSGCQESRPAPPSAPLHPWSWPSEPWSRLHIDSAAPFMGKMYLVLVDTHSKWMDVEIISQITAPQTIEKLRSIFAVHGLPKKVVSDNGPTFISHKFQEFMERYGIVHVKAAPYHPSSNGLAERAVRSFKQGLKSITGKSVQEKLPKFLLKYRITPHSTTGILPAEMLMKRCLRTKLDFRYPDVNRTRELYSNRKNRKRLTITHFLFAPSKLEILFMLKILLHLRDGFQPLCCIPLNIRTLI